MSQEELETEIKQIQAQLWREEASKITDYFEHKKFEESKTSKYLLEEAKELLESENNFSTDRAELYEEILLECLEDDRVKTKVMGPNKKHPVPFIKIIVKNKPFMCVESGDKTKNVGHPVGKKGNWKKGSLTIWPYSKDKKFKPLIDKLPCVLGWDDNCHHYDLIGKPKTMFHDIIDKCIEHLVPKKTR